MKKSMLLIGLVVSVVMLSGCAQNCATIHSGANKGAIVGPSKLSRNVSVSATASSLAGDLMVGKVMMANRTDDQQQLRYSFQWQSVDGSPLGEPSPWQPLSLEPNISQVVTSTAPNSEATQFNVLVCQ